ncbi:MAG TPA: pilus assembly protein PilM [Candidatus Bathyarchaeia archaeon]|nr:pilus assembly protein PilM [Candidatus Bathyarchaeia archaeon]
MLFAKRRKNYFALSFSDQEIRLAQVDQKGNLVLNSKLELKSGIIERGWIRKAQELVTLLGNFLKPLKLKKRFVAVGLPEIVSFSRVLTLPALPSEELDDAVRWQIESLLPLPLNETYLDWMLLDKDETSVRVLVMALPAQLIEDFAKVLENLNLVPVAFEPTSLSLSRLAEKGDKNCLIVEINEKEAVLVLVGPHGEIELTSTTAFKDQGIKENLPVTIEELLGFYKKKFSEKAKIVKVLLCGGGVSDELTAEIKKKTSLETAPIPIKPLGFASTISLAKKDVAAPIDEKTVNLIPPRIQGVFDLAEKSRVLSNWVKFWLFSLFLILFAFGVTAARVYFDLKQIEGEIIERQVKITPEMKKVEGEAKRITKKASQILTLVDASRETISLLGLIQAAVPEGISLNHYSIDFGKQQIIINGVADHRDQLIKFKQALENEEKLSQVRIPLSSLEKEENVVFTVSLIAKTGS